MLMISMIAQLGNSHSSLLRKHYEGDDLVKKIDHAH